MKTSHFEGRIASGAAEAAQGRDEYPQREQTAFDFNLGSQWLSRRRIVRELCVNRETVGRHLRLAQSKPAVPLTGESGQPEANPAISLTGSEGDLVSKPAIVHTGSCKHFARCCK